MRREKSQVRIGAESINMPRVRIGVSGFTSMKECLMVRKNESVKFGVKSEDDQDLENVQDDGGKSEAVKFGTKSVDGQELLDAMLAYDYEKLTEITKKFGLKASDMHWCMMNDANESKVLKMFKDLKVTKELVDELDRKVKEPFIGMEWLIIAGLTDKSSNIFKNSDFKYNNLEGMEDCYVYSLIYGGARLKAHQKFGDMTQVYVAESLEFYLGQDYENLYRDANKVRVSNISDSGKSEIIEILESIGKVYDVEVDEPQESSTWTITIK